MPVEIFAVIIASLVTVFMGLIGVVWFLLWRTIEGLRLDVSQLRETVLELRLTIASMK